MSEISPREMFKTNIQRLRGLGWRFFSPFLILLLAVLLFLLMVKFRPEVESIEVVPVVKAVRVMEVRPGRENLFVRSQGTVTPRTETSITSEVFGKVEWVSPALVSGGSFDQGDALLRIEDADYRNVVARNQAAVVRAEVELELAQSEYDRQNQLLDKKLSSQSQLDKSRRAFRVAEANLTEVRIDLSQARLDLQRTQITAPYRGRVRSETVDAGQFVSRGEVMAKIYATDVLEVRLPIANPQFAYLSLAATTRGLIDKSQAPDVRVTGEYAGQEFSWRGKLERTEAEIDQASRMFYGVATVENVTPSDESPPLVVGLFVHAQIAGREVDGVVRLPRTAMREGDQVLIVDQHNRLRFRQVDVLRTEYDEVLIQGGLSAGERVCVSPLDIVVDGMQVEPINVSADIDVLQESVDTTSLGQPLGQGVQLQPGSVQDSSRAAGP